MTGPQSEGQDPTTEQLDGGDEAGSTPPPGPTTEQLRIAALQAAVAAGLAPSTGRHESRRVEEPEVLAIPELPDWADPPTGQVPRVLLDPEALEDNPDAHLAPPMRGPTWRQEASDWDDGLGLGFLLDEAESQIDAGLIAGREPEEGGDDPLAASLDELDDDPFADLGARSPLEAPRPRHASQRRGARPPRRSRPLARPSEPATPAGEPAGGEPTAGGDAGGRSAVVATATGLGVGAVAVACFLLGSVSSLVLVAVALSVAAGEAYGTLRRSGARPASGLGLVAVPLLVVGAYLWGAEIVSFVLAGLLIAGACWYLASPGRTAVVRDLGSTLFVACWVGVPGAFAGLLLAPARFPHRHGVAFLFAVIAVTVAHDVGSYAVGSRLGRHKLAPRVSPNKTYEGLIGGTVLAFVVALGGLSQLHPISLAAAAGLAAVVSILAPLGDLLESLVKRDVGVKDMGRLLPAHGGLFDRVDAMLLVLPAAYGLFRLVHLG